jgi:uncharacterized protein (UPF0371 family)
MNFRVGFDTNKYVEEQAKYILERVGKFDQKLYLEFGGKLLFDYHAARVLPGYDPHTKIRILQKLKDSVEIVVCISSQDIQSGKQTGTLGISYGDFILRLIDDLRGYNLKVSNVVITMFNGESAAIKMKHFLESRNVRVYTTKIIEGYPTNIEKITGEEGYGSFPNIETTKPVVVVTGAGPCSGKMSTCLALVYKDKQKGIDAGYAKFETFPIWNLPLDHPVNFAYESATADLKDFNLIDPHHLKAHNKVAVNYNRDVENFVIIQRILKSIISPDNFMNNYHSPTDMGVNMAKCGIVDDEVCSRAANQEIIRRYFLYYQDYLQGTEKWETVCVAEKLIEKLNLKKEHRVTVVHARDTAKSAKFNGKGYKDTYCGAALELCDGTIITGKNSPLLYAEAAALLNAIKFVAGIPDQIELISAEVLGQIKDFKTNHYNEDAESLDVASTLIALAISAATNPTAKLALQQLSKLKNSEIHTTHLPNRGDEDSLRKLGINLTTDGLVSSNKLYHR